MAVAAFVSVAVALAFAAPAPKPTVDRFDEQAAWSFLVKQVRLGPRPAGSAASRKLAAMLKAALPRGAFQPIPGHPGLRNVVGWVPGKDPKRYIVVGAHYDTKAIPGFVGANDGAGGTAIVLQLARALKPKQIKPSVLFIFFDGEEAPGDGPFEETGLRGSKYAATKYKRAEAMILLDFVADKDLSIPRETQYSDAALWAKLRAAARRVGVGAVFPNTTQGGVQDDHLPFAELGIPSIDLIDFDFPCWHRLCDDLHAVSIRSVDAVGETVVELLRSL